MKTSTSTLLVLSAILLIGVGVIITTSMEGPPGLSRNTPNTAPQNSNEYIHTLSLSQSEDPDVLSQENQDINIDLMDIDAADYDLTLQKISEGEEF